MISANIHEAKTQLSKLIERAEAGEEVVIARAGKPAVRLVPVEPPVTLSRRERWDALRAELKARGQEIWIATDIEEVEAQIAAEMNGDFEDDDGAPR